MSIVYVVNKHVDRPVSFKGFTGQYIWWLGIGIALLIMLFALLYITGVHLLLCVLLISSGGAVLLAIVGRLSRRYGEHGLMKRHAQRYIPVHLKGCLFK